jgi:hypothetical protein
MKADKVYIRAYKRNRANQKRAVRSAIGQPERNNARRGDELPLQQIGLALFRLYDLQPESLLILVWGTSTLAFLVWRPNPLGLR